MNKVYFKLRLQFVTHLLLLLVLLIQWIVQQIFRQNATKKLMKLFCSQFRCFATHYEGAAEQGPGPDPSKRVSTVVAGHEELQASNTQIMSVTHFQ